MTEYYDVEEIVDADFIDGKKHYEIKWKGHPCKLNSISVIKWNNSQWQTVIFDPIRLTG